MKGTEPMTPTPEAMTPQLTAESVRLLVDHSQYRGCTMASLTIRDRLAAIESAAVAPWREALLNVATAVIDGHGPCWCWEVPLSELEHEDACDAARTLAARPASEVVRPVHQPDDHHQYRITCEVCGEQGNIVLSLEPQRAARPASEVGGEPFPVTDPDQDAPDGTRMLFERHGGSWEPVR